MPNRTHNTPRDRPARRPACGKSFCDRLVLDDVDERLVELLGSGRSLPGATERAAPGMQGVGLVARQAVAPECLPRAAERGVRLVDVLDAEHDGLGERHA